MNNTATLFAILYALSLVITAALVGVFSSSFIMASRHGRRIGSQRVWSPAQGHLLMALLMGVFLVGQLAFLIAGGAETVLLATPAAVKCDQAHQGDTVK